MKYTRLDILNLDIALLLSDSLMLELVTRPAYDKLRTQPVR